MDLDEKYQAYVYGTDIYVHLKFNADPKRNPDLDSLNVSSYIWAPP